MKVIIDPYRGGNDTGKEINGQYEKNILLNLDIPYLKEVYVVVIDKELIMASLQYDYYGTNYEKEIKIKTIRKGEKCNGEYIE